VSKDQLLAAVFFKKPEVPDKFSIAFTSSALPISDKL
jgi:hypothetical protein